MCSSFYVTKSPILRGYLIQVSKLQHMSCNYITLHQFYPLNRYKNETTFLLQEKTFSVNNKKTSQICSYWQLIQFFINNYNNNKFLLFDNRLLNIKLKKYPCEYTPMSIKCYCKLKTNSIFLCFIPTSSDLSFKPKKNVI